MSFTRALATVLSTLIAASSLGCGASSEEPYGGDVVRSDKQRVSAPSVASADLTTQVSGNTAFAFDLYQQLRGKPGNLFYSPHSMSMALAMLYAGARGATEQQMAQAMHFDLQQDKLHPVFNKLDLELNSRGQGKTGADGKAFRLNVVNATWGQRGYSFLPGYLDTLALSYGAGLRLLDFAAQPEDSRKVINTWVEDQTEQRIKDLLPQGTIDSDTRLVLTNAIYFNAAWAEAFEEKNTKDGPFSLVDGTELTVPRMSGTMKGSYATGQDLQVAALPYDGHELSMLLIVPDQGKLDAVEQSLTGAVVEGLVQQLQPAEIILTLPKFEFEAEQDLVEPLKALGMVDAFGAQADLSGINGKRDLFVSAVLHKAFVKVNEAGTEAAAATAVVVGETSVQPNPPVTLLVDRPFLFVIRDHATGAILFIGRVVKPA